MTDLFSERCGDLLTGSYDCVDRIVLNAYFPLGHSPGGFRVWWRRWHGDSDEQLDNAHLMRLAGGGATNPTPVPGPTMAHNAANPARYFGFPDDCTVTMGERIES
jgi:hypothetical protein